MHVFALSFGEGLGESIFGEGWGEATFLHLLIYVSAILAKTITG